MGNHFSDNKRQSVLIDNFKVSLNQLQNLIPKKPKVGNLIIKSYYDDIVNAIVVDNIGNIRFDMINSLIILMEVEYSNFSKSDKKKWKHVANSFKSLFGKLCPIETITSDFKSSIKLTNLATQDQIDNAYLTLFSDKPTAKFEADCIEDRNIKEYITNIENLLLECWFLPNGESRTDCGFLTKSKIQKLGKQARGYNIYNANTTNKEMKYFWCQKALAVENLKNYYDQTFNRVFSLEKQ